MSFIDPLLNPLLSLGTLWAVILVSLLIAVLITVIYKFTTNQSLMKQLKDEMKEFQKEMKELKAHPEKMMAVQKKAMQTNMKYMSHSMRSTLFTFIPIILIFGWMNAHLAFEPLLPDEEFKIALTFDKDIKGDVEMVVPSGVTVIGNNIKNIIDGRTSWILKGEEGDYIDENALRFDYAGKTAYKDIIITKDPRYTKPIEPRRGDIKNVEVGNKPMKLLNLFGWKVGWLGTYIIFSIIFSMIIRKILKVY